MDASVLTKTVVWWGFGLGIVFGFIANKTNFCTMGAVSDVVNMGHWGRMRGGNLRSVVVFIFLGFAAMATLKGILGAFRVNVLQVPAVTIQLEHGQTLPAILSGIGGLSPNTLQLAIACVTGPAILIFVFKDKRFRQSLDNNLAGLILWLLVIGGWYVNGRLGFGENPDTLAMTYLGTNSHLAESMSFVAPTAYTLEYWAYWTDASNIITFGVASVFGVAIGSFLYAMVYKSFRWEAFSSVQDMFYHIIA